MVKFIGGPYDGQEMELSIPAPSLRLPEIDEWDFKEDPGATTPRSCPHLYELDESAEPVYRYKGNNQPAQ